MRNLDDAAAHFKGGHTFCCDAGNLRVIAWPLCDCADMLLERNGEGDRQKAMQLLKESLAISTDLGMWPLMERVLSRREMPKA